MINFIKQQDNYFIEGITNRGNQIYFVEVPENKLIFQENEHSKHSSENLKGKGEPTRIVIYSNITISDKMKEAISESKILKIVQFCNRNQQIVAHPLKGFNYDKLKKALTDFTDKFNL